MTFPVVWHFWGLPVQAHQILELVAYSAGFQLYLILRRRWPKGPAMTVHQTGWVLIGAIFGALAGAKGLAWIESFPQYYGHFGDWRILVGGKTIVGALLGGWVGVEIAKRRLGLSHPSGDIYVFPVILGMCIGRVGCFLAGLTDQTFGIPTRLPWGVDFGDGPRHPTQLYEILFLLLLAGVFAWRLRTGRQRGCMFSQFMMGYLAFRLVIEFLKPRYTLPVLPLSAIQLASLGGIGYAVLHWNDQCCGKNEARGKEAPPAEENGSVPTTHCDGVASAGEPGSTFVELTASLCPICLTKVDAKVLLEPAGVFLQKFCPTHGRQRVLIADDAAFWRRSRSPYHKPATAPPRCATPQRRGCPWDCGLCPDHEQHTCLAIVEITDRCDLGCRFCYAGSTAAGADRPLPHVEAMLDAAAAAIAGPEGSGVVQISGGEPCLHPQLFEILAAAKARPIRHLMLNTNGQRLAAEPDFARRLAELGPGFEIYLQFDSLRADSLRKLRGSDLSDLRRRAVDALNRAGLSTTLVVMLQKGVNDLEIGEILDFALAQPCVRGVTFQPIQAAGRVADSFDAEDRLTLTAVRRAILKQHALFTAADLVPVPCHPDCLAMGYALRRGTEAVPLSRLGNPEKFAQVGGNTICYEQDPKLREQLAHLVSPLAAARELGLSCCLPLTPTKDSALAYDQVFRVVIMQFMDAWSMDLRSLKRSCVHIVQPDGRLVPFETHNLLYRRALAHSTTAPSENENRMQSHSMGVCQ